MERIGGISPALARFLGYRLHARDLEARKAARPSSPEQAARWALICAAHEAALDRAWEEVDALEGVAGRMAADLVARHYLLGEDWHDLTASAGVPYNAAKKRAYRAFELVDERNGELRQNNRHAEAAIRRAKYRSRRSESDGQR